MVVTLIGYRGTGKSTVAPHLADRLGWGWVDADAAIEAAAGKSIREIFADEGESAFREREREIMQLLLQTGNVVIAAGGGAIVNEQTRHDVRAAGPVVWLKASAETIVSRMETDAMTAQRRPNLTAIGGRREVDRLLAVREPLYRQCADVIVDTDGRDARSIVEEIIAAIEPRLGEGAAG
ncbi:MAG: shikimate kinase [Planctomycetaceae bacterium]